jgi:hypothetical protein
MAFIYQTELRLLLTMLPRSTARQGTGPREMFWVLVGPIALAVIGGLTLGVAYGWIPLAWSVMPLK